MMALYHSQTRRHFLSDKFTLVSNSLWELNNLWVFYNSKFKSEDSAGKIYLKVKRQRSEIDTIKYHAHVRIQKVLSEGIQIW